MKIISIKQPWASLIVHGFKDIENRTWRTTYRGPVVIHASSRPNGMTLAEIREWIGKPLPNLELPTGGVVGVAEIVDCVDSHPSKWFVGPIGFVLTRQRTVPFKLWKGSLNIRDAPAELVRHCRA